MTSLHYVQEGSGPIVVLSHALGSNLGMWDAVAAALKDRFTVIRYDHRSHGKSEQFQIPFSIDDMADDAASLISTLTPNEKVSFVGLSMGGFATLHFGLQHPDRALSLVVAGCGYGAELEQGEQFRKEAEASAKMLLEQGMKAFVDKYAFGPTRLSFERADPRGFAEFIQQFYGHSALGSANTQLGVQRERPSLYNLKDQLKKLTVPTLIINGDEDWPCLKPGLMLKETIPSAALAILPNCGHTMNIEMPNEFNHALEQFLQHASSGRWPMRDPRAMVASITGMK